MASHTIKGLTTIHWGTFNSVNITNAVVTRLALTRKNGDPIEIEGENGFTKAQVIINDGFNATATLLVQTANVTYPNVGDFVLLHLPVIGSNTNCLVVSGPEIDMEKKREATVTFKLTNRPDINA